MKLIIGADGSIRGIYSDEVPYREIGAALGRYYCARASHVEPTPDGRWQADMAPVGGPILPVTESRSESLEAERAWLEENL